MKNHIIIPAASICLLCFCVSACTEEPIDTQEVSQSSMELTVTATMDDDPYTKTGVITNNGKKSVIWSSGDAISLFFNTGDNGGSRFVTEDSGTKATFSGSISSISGDLSELGNTAYFWGLYPYNENASCNGTSIFTTLPSEQVGVPDTFADNTAVTIGRSENLAISFKNTNTIFAFKVAHDNIHRVKMYGNNGEKISGNYSVSFDSDGKVVITPAEDALDYVYVTPAEGSFFVPDTWYYIVTLPVVFSGGYSMDFDTITERATYTTTDTKTFKVSTFYTLTNKDSGLEFSLRNENVPFEDANFKAYCVQNFDTDGDGEISIMEAGEVTVMNILGTSLLGSKSEDFDVVFKITTLNGLEYFKNLEEFSFESLEIEISSNYPPLTIYHFSPLNKADFSKNNSLTHLSVGWTSLSSLDVSNNTALTSLSCGYNQLTSLDVSNNTALTYLDCSGNQLTFLDVSNNTALADLSCGNNQLTSLDLSKNTALTSLYCSGNQLTSLDVSNNTALTSLSCGGNQLTSLDVSNNTALADLSCGNNQLTSLDVSNSTVLEILGCSSNQLTSLDVSGCTALSRLECNNNKLTSLDVSKNTALTWLECYGNQLTSLDVSNNTALTWLECYGNQLTSLDVSNNTALTSLYCYSNQLTSLDVSNITDLWILRCSPMIDSEGNNLLEFLYISEGQYIPGVTENRNSDNIPEETIIRLVPNDDDSPLEDPKDGGEWGWN